MSMPALLTEYIWQSPEFPICTVNVPVAELALRLGFPLAEWEEPGLGRATGFGCRLASGLVVMLEELAHARDHLGAAGPALYIEGHDLAAMGVERALADVLAGLGLTPQNVAWVQTEAGFQSAVQAVEAARVGTRPAVGATTTKSSS